MKGHVGGGRGRVVSRLAVGSVDVYPLSRPSNEEDELLMRGVEALSAFLRGPGSLSS